LDEARFEDRLPDFFEARRYVGFFAGVALAATERKLIATKTARARFIL
jgi:hypothetical protein